MMLRRSTMPNERDDVDAERRCARCAMLARRMRRSEECMNAASAANVNDGGGRTAMKCWRWRRWRKACQMSASGRCGTNGAWRRRRKWRCQQIGLDRQGRVCVNAVGGAMQWQCVRRRKCWAGAMRRCWRVGVGLSSNNECVANLQPIA